MFPFVFVVLLAVAPLPLRAMLEATKFRLEDDPTTGREDQTLSYQERYNAAKQSANPNESTSAILKIRQTEDSQSEEQTYPNKKRTQKPMNPNILNTDSSRSTSSTYPAEVTGVVIPRKIGNMQGVRIYQEERIPADQARKKARMATGFGISSNPESPGIKVPVADLTTTGTSSQDDDGIASTLITGIPDRELISWLHARYNQEQRAQIFEDIVRRIINENRTQYNSLPSQQRLRKELLKAFSNQDEIFYLDQNQEVDTKAPLYTLQSISEEKETSFGESNLNKKRTLEIFSDEDHQVKRQRIKTSDSIEKHIASNLKKITNASEATKEAENQMEQLQKDLDDNKKRNKTAPYTFFSKAIDSFLYSIEANDEFIKFMDIGNTEQAHRFHTESATYFYKAFELIFEGKVLECKNLAGKTSSSSEKSLYRKALEAYDQASEWYCSAAKAKNDKNRMLSQKAGKLIQNGAQEYMKAAKATRESSEVGTAKEKKNFLDQAKMHKSSAKQYAEEEKIYANVYDFYDTILSKNLLEEGEEEEILENYAAALKNEASTKLAIGATDEQELIYELLLKASENQIDTYKEIYSEYDTTSIKQIETYKNELKAHDQKISALHQAAIAATDEERIAWEDKAKSYDDLLEYLYYQRSTLKCKNEAYKASLIAKKENIGYYQSAAKAYEKAFLAYEKATMAVATQEQKAYAKQGEKYNEAGSAYEAAARREDSVTRQADINIARENEIAASDAIPLSELMAKMSLSEL